MNENWIDSNGTVMPGYLHPDVLALKAPRRPTQDGVAKRFAQDQAGRLRYCHDAGAWYVWDGAVWRRDRTGLVPQRVREVAREMATNPSGEIFQPAGRKIFIAGVERLARDDPALAVGAQDWRDPPLVLATPAGPIDLDTGRAVPAEPGHWLRRATAVAPADEAECPLWRRFLGEVCEGEDERVGFLHRFLGAALTGLPAERRILFCQGPADSGKTVFLNTLLHVTGDYGAPVAPAFAAGPERQAGELRRLAGVRLATMSAAERGPNWNERRLARLTGGDPIVEPDGARFTLGCKLVAAGRRPPRLERFDSAMLRHLRIVPFARGPSRADPGLEHALRDEAPGILRWMIEGAAEWREKGLGGCETIERATFGHADDENMVGAFLVEHCCGRLEDKSRRVPAGRLYEAWCAYAQAAGETPGSKRGFVEAVAEHGFGRTRSESARLYLGLSLPET